MRVAHALRCVLVVGATVVLLSGCATIRKVFHMDDKSNKAAEQLQIQQHRVMRFADEYVGLIAVPIRQLQASTDNAEDRLAAQNWLLSQATAAYIIASGPSPVVNTVDMIVLAMLSRMVIDEAWVKERFGERAVPVRDEYNRLEPLALTLAQGVLTPAQLAELQKVVMEWRAQNPHVTAIAYVRFSHVTSTLGQATPGASGSSSGLFALLGLDPFSSLDPAVREIAQTRELGERTVYYAQRLPNLLDMQVERLTYEFATMPETKQLLANADNVAAAAKSTGSVVGELPNLIDREREAAIRQFMEALTVETAHTRDLVVQLRGALEAGTATSNSLNTTIHSFDQLVAGFEKPKAGGPSQTPGRPFDITEYTAAAAEIGRAAHDLEGLIAGIERGTPALDATAARAAATLQEAIDHAYRRMIELIGLMLLGGFGAALAYRGIVRRWLA
ncbi:MAG TPA: hypothetical protein VK251_10035 [Steroidobacteraceae bacterium]|nr:hypothetical protein [Steroidobacteraceae bacterium]